MTLTRSPRRLFAVVALAAVPLVALAGCSSSDDSSSTEEVGQNVLPPVILSATNTTATVKVGTTVTFDMGDPGEGKFVATSDNTKVFKVESEGRTEGSATFNAGGKALSAGTARVAVSYAGSMNGMGTPTTFTITVTAE